MLHSLPLSRRTVLRGLGATVALPMLDAMLPRTALAAAPAAPARPATLALLGLRTQRHSYAGLDASGGTAPASNCPRR